MKGNKKEAHSNQDQLRLVAWHEAGHALVAKLLTKKSVPKVTIIPSTSGAGGVTFIIPEKSGLHTKQDLINEIKTLYGGRIAEYLLLGDENLITIGASQDIKQATRLIVQMIREFGMSDAFGMLYIESVENEVIEEAKKISSLLYQETLKLMEEKKGILEDIALALINKETLIEEELDHILSQYA
jgi:cell division protease FtsH